MIARGRSPSVLLVAHRDSAAETPDSTRMARSHAAQLTYRALRERDLPRHHDIAGQPGNCDRRGCVERLVALQVTAFQLLANRKFDLPLSGHAPAS